MEFEFTGTHTEAEWEDWYRTNARVVEGGVELARETLPTYVSPTPVADRRTWTAVDLAVDDCDVAYVLLDDGDVYRYDPDRRSADRVDCLWTPADGGEPAAVAADADSLYISDRDSGRVRAVSKLGGQTRWVADGFADPVAMTTAAGSAYVLDAGDPGAPRTTAQGRVLRLGPGGATTAVVGKLYNPVDLASDTAGNVYVLGSRPSDDPFLKLFQVATFDAGDTTGATADVRVPASSFVRADTGRRFAPSCLEAVDDGELLVGVADANGAATVLRYRPVEDDFEPLPATVDLGATPESVATGCRALQTGAPRSDRDPTLYAVDDDGMVHSLAPAERYRATAGGHEATLSRRFDAGEHDVQWHRVTTELANAAGSTGGRGQLRLEYAATETDWTPADPSHEPDASTDVVSGIGDVYAGRLADAGVTTLGELVDRSPGELAAILGTDTHTVSLHEAADMLDSARSSLTVDPDLARLDWQDLGRPDPEDALLADATGRYLWVRLRLVGSATSSPRVEQFRAYFPRQSYLRYLPAIYREDAESAAFLERYLSLFESTVADLEAAAESASTFAEPRTIPAEHLSWLGDWVGVEADETWPTPAVRELIARSPDLYKQRGTRAGLVATIRLYLRHATGWAAMAPDADPTSPVPPTPAARRVALGRGKSASTTDRTSHSPTHVSTASGDRESVASTAGDGVGGVDGGEQSWWEAAGSDGSAPVGKSVYVLEHGDLSCIRGDRPAELYERFLSCAAGFHVLVHPGIADEHVETVSRIVERQQPAHASGRTTHLKDRVALNGHGTAEETDRGHHTYLGVNSRLTARDFQIGESGLGQDAVLGSREPYGELDRQSRLGEDARLN